MTRQKINWRAGNGRAGKILSIIYILLFVIGAGLIIASYSYPFSRTGSTLQNIGRTLSVLQFLPTIFLYSLQKRVYSVGGSHKDLDERQIAVRQRIFERSYKTFTTIFFGGLFIAVFNIEWIKSSLSQPFGNDLVWIAYTLLIFCFVLPSLFAAWEKDS